MTRFYTIILGAAISGIALLAIACGGGSSTPQPSTNNTGTTGSDNQPTVSQQVDHEDLEPCPPTTLNMKCFVRADTTRVGRGGYVVAYEGSTVYAEIGSWVEAYPSSKVYAYDGSTVRYRIGATVLIREDGADVELVYD